MFPLFLLLLSLIYHYIMTIVHPGYRWRSLLVSALHWESRWLHHRLMARIDSLSDLHLPRSTSARMLLTFCSTTECCVDDLFSHASKKDISQSKRSCFWLFRHNSSKWFCGENIICLNTYATWLTRFVSRLLLPLIPWTFELLNKQWFSYGFYWKHIFV